VELREEINFIKLYLSISGDEVFRSTPDRARHRSAHDEALVPNLIPATSNGKRTATRHRPQREFRPDRIRSVAEDGYLRLTVYDEGAGLPDDWQLKGSAGIGLANTIARLQQLYDDDHEFDIRNRDRGGVEVVIVMPLRTAS
jgi:LytS/YehU family sensor histidine kinase